jgi:hypothetical protein
MQIVKTAIRSKKQTVVAGVNQLVPASKSIVINGADIDVSEYGYGVIVIKAGNKTGTATLDVKYQVKDSLGNYYDHTSATQVTTAGSSIKTIDNLDGQIGRLVVTINGTSEGDGFNGVVVEFIIKSR